MCKLEIHTRLASQIYSKCTVIFYIQVILTIMMRLVYILDDTADCTIKIKTY